MPIRWRSPNQINATAALPRFPIDNTLRNLSPLRHQLWRCARGRRSDMENRIAERKHDLGGADGFCLQEFFATEAAFQSILLLFNLLAEFQRAAGLPIYREPATLHTQVFTCGAILGRAGRRLVLHLSQSWCGLKTRSPLLDKILSWEIPISPKLDSALIT